MSVSIFVQTLNEEHNLERCLKSVSFSDDIVVLDSFSTDGTERIARSFGAQWVQRTYTGRAEHQNWAMENIPWKHPWVYYSDADEVVPPELAAEIQAVTCAPNNKNAAYTVCRRDHFMGRWIKRSTQYPVHLTRLFRPPAIRWTRKANPIPHVEGPIGKLRNDFIHYPFSKGLSDWVWRHNRYSSFEAEETIRSLDAGDFSWGELFHRDWAIRRHAMKKLSFRVPLRHRFRFLYMYFLRRGFLDGRPGLIYCQLLSMYEYLIVLKVEEQRRKQTGRPF